MTVPKGCWGHCCRLTIWGQVCVACYNVGNTEDGVVPLEYALGGRRNPATSTMAVSMPSMTEITGDQDS